MLAWSHKFSSSIHNLAPSFLWYHIICYWNIQSIIWYIITATLMVEMQYVQSYAGNSNVTSLPVSFLYMAENTSNCVCGKCVCGHVCVWTCVHVDVCVCGRVCVWTCVCVDVCVRVDMCVCVFVRVVCMCVVPWGRVKRAIHKARATGCKSSLL